MKLTEALLRRAEEALTFDPREERRALLDRTVVAAGSPAALSRRIAQALGEGEDAADAAIDRLLSGSDQLNVSYLERGMIAADAVARVEVRDGDSQVVGFGTGFMISARLLLTNHHVLPTADDAAQSWVHFRNEFDALGRTVAPCTFALDPSEFFFTDADLDTTVVSVSPETPDRRQHVARFGWVRLSASEDTVLPGEWLTLIHHPAGRPKQVSLRQNLLVRRGGADLWYASDTAFGSSGAPVFNDSWQVVGVHRVGVPARDREGNILTVDGERWVDGSDESRIVWRAGTATRTPAILRRLAESCGEHPLIVELLADADADACDAVVIPLGAGVTQAAGSVAPHAERPFGKSGGNGGSLHEDGRAVQLPSRIMIHPGDGAARDPVPV